MCFVLFGFVFAKLAMSLCHFWRMIAKSTCLLRITFLFDNICVQANKMSEGPLFKAAEKGDVEASVLAIRETAQLQTMHRPPTSLSPS